MFLEGHDESKTNFIVPVIHGDVWFQKCFFGKGIAEMGFDLASYHWKNRVIIISAPSTATENYKIQRRELDNRTEEVLDCDPLILDLFDNEQSRVSDLFLTDDDVSKLKKLFGLKPDQFQVILIGKDRTIKLRSDKPVPTSELFRLTDTMPMRKEEMRRNNN